MDQERETAAGATAEARPVLLLWSHASESLLTVDVTERFEVVRPSHAAERENELKGRAADAMATITTRLSANQIDRLPSLRLIVVPGAGYEGIDMAAARARGITVANAGNAHSADVADHAVALAMASLHQLPALHEAVVSGGWKAGRQPPRRLALSSQRFGIVGLGNIGSAIAERLTAFGGDIAWWGPHDRPSRWPRHESLLELAHWCSVLIVATRGDAAGLIGSDVITAVGGDGLIVNVTRGAVIDEDALISALRDGHLGQAALDVFEEEPTPPQRWRDVPNVLLSPHVAGVSDRATAKLREAATQNLMHLIDGRPLVHELKS